MSEAYRWWDTDRVCFLNDEIGKPFAVVFRNPLDNFWKGWVIVNGAVILVLNTIDQNNHGDSELAVCKRKVTERMGQLGMLSGFPLTPLPCGATISSDVNSQREDTHESNGHGVQ